MTRCLMSLSAMALLAPSVALAGPFNVLWSGGECAYAEPEIDAGMDLNRDGTGMWRRDWGFGSPAVDSFEWTYDHDTLEFVAVMDFGYTYEGTYDPVTQCVQGVGDYTFLWDPYYSWPTDFFVCQGAVPFGMDC
jgi:hypothetical protein